MKTKGFLKFAGRQSGWAFLLFVNFMTKLLPEAFSRAVLKSAARACYAVPGYRRAVIEKNIEWVFGRENRLGETRRVLDSMMANIVNNLLELMKLDSQNYRNIKNAVILEGKDNLDGALSGGKGVIAVSAHLGNFPIACARLVAEGYGYAAMAGNARDERVGGYFSGLWKRQGMVIIPSLPAFSAMSRSLEVLKSNMILAIYADQNRVRGGLFADFFGKPASTVSSPAALSLKTGAPIVPLFMVREGPYRHRMIIEEPLETGQKTGDEAETIMAITVKINGIIEKYILKYPEQWWWFHDRWKTRP